MADVDVIQTVTETKKTRKVKKTTKRRESADQGSEITITEIEQTTNENNVKDEGYVMNSIIFFFSSVNPSFFKHFQFLYLCIYEYLIVVINKCWKFEMKCVWIIMTMKNFVK